MISQEIIASFIGCMIFHAVGMKIFFHFLGDVKCIIDNFPLYAQWYSIFANLVPVILFNHVQIFTMFLCAKYIYDFYHLREYHWPTMIIVHHVFSISIFLYPLSMIDPMPFIYTTVCGKVGSAAFGLYLIKGWKNQYFYIMTATHMVGLYAGLPGLQETGSYAWATVAWIMVFFRQKAVTEVYFEKEAKD